jgi:hypothetical protein
MMIAAAIIALLLTNALWLALLVSGRLRWSMRDRRPNCVACPIAKSLQQPYIPKLTEEAALAIH